MAETLYRVVYDVRTLTTLDIFVDRALSLRQKSPELSGFHCNRELLRAAMANTYLETVGERADSIHLAIGKVPMSAVYYGYLKTLQVMDRRSDFSAHDAVLAFDCTDEDFYGRLNGIWMHAWTGEHAVAGKFRFLTCPLVSHDMPEKVPLLSIPVHAGNNMAVDVCYCLSLIRPLFRSVRLVLFDRGFHNNELMYALAHRHPLSPLPEEDGNGEERTRRHASG